MKANIIDDIGTTTRKPGRSRKVERIEETSVIKLEKRGRKRFELPPMPKIEKGEKTKISITFPLDKDCLAKTEFENIYFLYPRLCDFPTRKLGASNNPREHSADCLKNSIMQAANETLVQTPEFFHLINRGLTILAHSFEYKNGKATITVTNNNEGVADGASTESLIAKAQMLVEQIRQQNLELPEEEQQQVPDYLERGRLRIELIVGIKDHDLIATIVSARNSSKPVKNFSMANFKGTFDFLKAEIEKENAPFKNKIAYEENGEGVSVLNILAVLNLFHPEYNEMGENNKVKMPTISYSGKGRLPERLDNETLLNGYKSLLPIANQILELSEYIYANFNKAYTKVFKDGSRLGRRAGFISKRLDEDKIILPLTGFESDYKIENGILYPLINAFRALVVWKDNVAQFKQEPKAFFDKYGPRLVSHLIEELESEKTPNALGKSTRSYTTLNREIELILAKES